LVDNLFTSPSRISLTRKFTLAQNSIALFG
jgi:hypothetical protein